MINSTTKQKCIAVNCQCTETKTYLRRGFGDNIAMCEKHISKDMWNLSVGQLSKSPILPSVRAYKRLS